MIKLDNVHKAFGSNQVLRGMTLEVPKGTSMVIIGGSGTGKSVALKCVLGLIKPDSGSILVDGKPADAGDRDAFLARFGMLFQGGALFDSLPVWQNVAFRLMRGALKRPAEEAREIAVEKLRRVGLKPDVADRLPAELSGGMQKRVGIARAVALQPEALIYDEPFEGLDPINVTRVNRLMLGLRDQLNVTTMVATHNLKAAFEVSDRIAFLHEGQIARIGSPDELAKDHPDAMKDFIEKATFETPEL